MKDEDSNESKIKQNIDMINKIVKLLNEDSQVEAYRIKYGNVTRSKGKVPKISCTGDK
jgi:hypothetical protein